MITGDDTNWHEDIFATLRALEITLVAHVPDAGHARLLDACTLASEMRVVTLTTEQDGVGLLCGAWAGGVRGVMLMQSSGVGNTINALSLAAACRIPFFTIVSMRGEWGEFIPWQVPMGQATPAVLEAMGVRVLRVSSPADVGPTVDAAARLAFNTRAATAVLLAQRLIGAKEFKAGGTHAAPA